MDEGQEYRAGPLVWLSVLLGTCLVLFLFQKILWLVVPFILALITYYVLLPLKLRLVLAGLTHDAAAAVVALGGLVLLAGVVVVFSPQLALEVVSWPTTSGRYLEGGLRLLNTTLRQLENHVSLFEQAHVSEEVAGRIAELTGSFARRYLPDVVMSLAAWAPTLLLAPFLAFFMLRDGWRFKRFLGRAVPNAFFERTLTLLDQVDRTARLYFIGLLQLTVLDTIFLAAGLWFLGVSSPLLLGFLAAVLAWVPFVGSMLGCLLVVLVAATDFPAEPAMAYGAIALFVLVRLLDDFLFMPLTIGKSLNMHPLLTVLMIFVGGAVAGVAGLMLVLPVLGVLMVLGEAVGRVLSDERLRARHAHARALRKVVAWADLRA